MARIIPTRVGTRLSIVVTAFNNRDHPHACGDKRVVKKTGAIVLGSSPRVWGQEERRVHKRSQARIIPTRVGTRNNRERRKNRRKDHPHACGDKEVFTSRFIVYIGSSPRVWGQDAHKAVSCGCQRIIPTRVGTRHADDDLYYRVAGSSPRVWGQVNVISQQIDNYGIIPTRVGTSRCYS